MPSGPQPCSRDVSCTSQSVSEPADEMESVFPLRSPLVAERCVRVATDAQIASLRAINDSLVALADAGALDADFWKNLEFRDTEALIAGNERLRQLLDALGLQILVTRYAGLAQPDRLAVSAKQHEILLGAYETRNMELAVA